MNTNEAVEKMRGVNVKALQEAMGHKYAETTMGYVHAEALSVGSPLDTEAACRK